MHLLQTRIDPLLWEEATDNVFEVKDHLIDIEGQPRYTGNYISINQGNISVNVTNLTEQQSCIVMALLNRIAGVNVAPVTGKPWSAPPPETIRGIGKRNFIIEPHSGNIYNIVSPKSTPKIENDDSWKDEARKEIHKLKSAHTKEIYQLLKDKFPNINTHFIGKNR